MRIKQQFRFLLLACFTSIIGVSQFSLAQNTISTNKPWSERTALSVMQRSPEAWALRDFKLMEKPEWAYTYGLVLLGFQRLYEKTGEQQYFDYAKTYVDQLIDENGSIRDYHMTEFNIDSINSGKLLFLLHQKTQDPRYLTAMKTLRQQIEWQPRTRSGGLWHKLIYPYQMWLDGLYMGAPYYAQYAQQFGEDEKTFDDIAHQFILIESKTRDTKTGLLYHAWDESTLQLWADDETGLSPHFWSRAMGWYAMALVDVLDYFPEEHKDRAELIAILNRLAEALTKVQDKTGLWYQVTDQGNRYGNYLEASGTAMFTYAFAKGAKKGYLPARYTSVANKAYEGMLKHLVEVDDQKQIHLTQICGSAGLGGDPYRPGNFQYYVSEAIRTDDPHGIGPFILASIELDK